MSAIAAAPVYPPKSLRWMIAFSVSLAALLEVIDTSIVNVALTDMQASLGATLSEVGWVVTSYGIANVIMIPLSAWLGDAFGKKRYFVFSMVGFTAASVMCGLAPTLPLLIAGRILQGLAGGGLLAKAQAFLFESFPKEEQGMAQATFGVCVIAGPAIGPTLGGWLTTNYSWPWIFFINLPVGITATIMCLSFLPQDPIRKKVVDVDWLGIGLLVLWVGSLQTLLEQGNEEDWFDSSLIRTLAVFVTFGSILWVWRELKAKKPAVDLAVLKYRSLAAGSAYSFVLGIGLYGALFAVPIFAQQVLGYTAYQTGMLLLPGALASAFMMPVMGRLANKFDARILIGIGSLILVSSMLMLSRISIDTGLEGLFWPMIIRGIGTVTMFLPLSLATFGPLPRKDVSAASGFYNLTRQLGGSVGIAVLTTILANRENYHQSVLSTYINPGSPVAMSRLNALAAGFMSHGADSTAAKKEALALLNGMVGVQSAVLSFADMFHIVAILFIATMVLLFLLGSGRGAKPAADPH